MEHFKKIGFGGGCHWCTEAVFQALTGVIKVAQGYISSSGEASSFSEAVIVTYDPEVIPLEILIEIHLYTHNSTSNHSFREKYRSAIYFFTSKDDEKSRHALEKLQLKFEDQIITAILPFKEFKASRESLQDYYLKDPEKPFCKRYINQKLEFLRKQFEKNVQL